MKIYKYPSRKEWAQIIARPHIDAKELAGMVKNILDDVKANGDEAVKRYEKKFDHAELSSLSVSQFEIDEALAAISTELYEAITFAH